jgi:hypothetical protein
MIEYRRFWDEPERSAYRHLAEFRELFGEGKNDFSDPQALVDLAGVESQEEHAKVFGELHEVRDARSRKARMRDLDVMPYLSLRISL